MSSGPSDKALEAALAHKWSVRDALAAAHDPALGPYRSVCLLDMVEALREMDDAGTVGRMAGLLAADFLLRNGGSV